VYEEISIEGVTDGVGSFEKLKDIRTPIIPINITIEIIPYKILEGINNFSIKSHIFN
jgi:hypothetical protein